MKRSKIGRTGWFFLYVIAGIIDVAQFLIGVFGAALAAFAIGAFLLAANDIADPFIGAVAIGYFQWKGVSMIKHWSRALSLLSVGVIAEISQGVASFWILDVWWLHRSVKKEEAELDDLEKAQLTAQMADGPLNTENVRFPKRRSSPLNFQGSRTPTR